MIPWQLLAGAPAPGAGEELRLYRRGEEFSIRLGGAELMNSRRHGSEEALAAFACACIAALPSPRVLIGGLGMGYTLAAVLRELGPASRIEAAELVPAVVAWNRGPLAPLAGHPLDDSRVRVVETDVAQLIRAEERAFDAILLDVDNGPRGLTQQGNDRLYSRGGLNAAFRALRPAGVFALWSAGPDLPFSQSLRRAGFMVEEKQVRAQGPGKGGFHTLWIARRGR